MECIYKKSVRTASSASAKEVHATFKILGDPVVAFKYVHEHDCYLKLPTVNYLRSSTALFPGIHCDVVV